jgi:UDP-N-acetylglucosamine:LPS N-acetylglucosamine transferase
VKICLVCSHGGHLTETLQLLEVLADHRLVFATYHSPRDALVQQMAPAYLTANLGTSPRRMLVAALWAWRVLRSERPDVVVSLGAEIALPFLYLGKLMGAKTLYIESWCRVETLSLTGRLVYPVADEFWVQWPELVPRCGPRARYRGAVI